MWPERTDPHKFVYEDVAIATYLLVSGTLIISINFNCIEYLGNLMNKCNNTNLAPVGRK